MSEEVKAKKKRNLSNDVIDKKISELLDMKAENDKIEKQKEREKIKKMKEKNNPKIANKIRGIFKKNSDDEIIDYLNKNDVANYLKLAELVIKFHKNECKNIIAYYERKIAEKYGNQN